VQDLPSSRSPAAPPHSCFPPCRKSLRPPSPRSTSHAFTRRHPTNPPPTSMLDALISNIQDAIVLIGRDGKVVFESPSASDLLGPRPAGTPRTFTLGRIHPDERAGVVEAFERTCGRPGAVQRGTYRCQTSDSEWRHREAVAKNLLGD